MTSFRLSLAAVAVLGLALTACHREAAAAASRAYPLDTCIVSGEKLGNHGDPYVLVRDGQEVKLCCENCLEEFNSNADKLIKQLAEKPKP